MPQVQSCGAQPRMVRSPRPRLTRRHTPVVRKTLWHQPLRPHLRTGPTAEMQSILARLSSRLLSPAMPYTASAGQSAAPGVPSRFLKSGKGHTGARARFSRTPANRVDSLGVLTRGRSGLRHLNLHKSGRRLARLGSARGVSSADMKRVKRLMPFS